jgi:hypothetical protein
LAEKASYSVPKVFRKVGSFLYVEDVDAFFKKALAA